MADISEVESTMVSLIAGYLDLGSTYVPGSAASSPVAKAQCRVFRGWPTAAALDTDLAAGISCISVFPVSGATRRTTRYVPEWQAGVALPVTLAATVYGDEVVISGTPSTTQVVGIEFGVPLNTSTFSYRPAAADTPLSIATALGNMIPNATVTGPVITIPNVPGLAATVVADQPMWAEVRRQDQQVWVIGWCPNPSIRDVLMKAVDVGFGGMMTPGGNLTDQFPLPDGSSARLLYVSSHTDDQPQRAGVWRRDLRYVVCYPTTITRTFPTMIFGIGTSTETDFDAEISVSVGKSTPP